MAAGIPFRAARLELPLEDPGLDRVLAEARKMATRGEPLLLTLGRCRAHATDERTQRMAATLLAWAPAFNDLATFLAGIEDARRRLADLRRDDALLTLATAHATKGLEFDHVIVLGMEAGRFPSARAVDNAQDPARAYEEERRLAYVAWTRARRTLTLLYDPTVPSPFLLEAFSADELGLSSGPG
jgi:superfamily I DNA/RNA helicase